MIDINKEIKKMMIDKDITQTELAIRLGISQSNLAQKLKRNNLSINDLRAITEALGYKLNVEFIKENN